MTVRLIGSRGDTPRPQSVGAIRIDNPVDNDPMTQPAYYDTARNGVVTMRLPVGVYDIQVAMTEHEEDIRRATLMTETEFAVTGPAEVTLDARKAVNVRPPTSAPTDMPSVSFGTLRGLADGTVLPFSMLIGGSQYEGYATPTKPVKIGFFEFHNQWTLSEALVDLRVRGGGRLSPDYDLLTVSSHLDGKQRSLPVVFAGAGKPEELAAAGVKGRAALVRIQIPADMTWPWRHVQALNEARAARDAAAAAGAALALVYVDVANAPALLGNSVPSTDDIVALTLSRTEGEALRKRGRTTLTLGGESNPSYVYHLRRDHLDGVPSTPERPVNPKAMVKLETEYHADKPHMFDSIWGVLGPKDPFSSETTWRFPGPTARTEYVGEGDDLRWLRYIIQVGMLAQVAHSRTEPAPQEIAIVSGGREMHLAAVASALHGESGAPEGAVLVFDDVTPLIRSQKVAAWREVARRLAHEIKNPLTPIQLSAERLRRHFGGAPPATQALVDECTSTIVGEVEALKGLVDEFSQFARMPAPRASRQRSMHSSTKRSGSTRGCSRACASSGATIQRCTWSGSMRSR